MYGEVAEGSGRELGSLRGIAIQGTREERDGTGNNGITVQDEVPLQPNDHHSSVTVVN